MFKASKYRVNEIILKDEADCVIKDGEIIAICPKNPEMASLIAAALNMMNGEHLRKKGL